MHHPRIMLHKPRIKTTRENPRIVLIYLELTMCIAKILTKALMVDLGNAGCALQVIYIELQLQ